MCEFCENNNTEKKIEYRTCFEGDNVCDFLRPDYKYDSQCEICDGCLDKNNEFGISLKCGNYLDITYTRIIPSNLNKEFEEFRLSAISEGIKIKYCLFCGRKLKE